MADSISNFNLAINSLSYLGLDTRAIRKLAPGVAYFEIDDENILAFKKGRLEENGIDTNVRIIPGNYIIDAHIDLLKKSEFDFERPTHFIWEGNTMYLTAAAVSQVFADITRYVRQFTVSFDYVTEEVISNTTGDPEITSVVERFAAMGAPWIYGISDVLSLADKAMATILEHVKVADLHRAYWPTQPLDSPIYDYCSICTLQAVVTPV
jgi:methyltransferase (TIGR00027 family)